MKLTDFVTKHAELCNFPVGSATCSTHFAVCFEHAETLARDYAQAVLLEAARRLRDDPSCVTEVDSRMLLGEFADEIRTGKW